MPDSDGVIPFSSLQPGMTVWMEWPDLTHLLRMEIIYVGDKRVKARCWWNEELCNVLTVKEQTNRRLWDHNPTAQEREETAWSADR